MSITESGQEFIDRETQLPADDRALGGGVAPGQLDGVPLGNPAIDYDVRSTFDVRPVNAFDFDASGQADYENLGEGFGRWVVVAFTVPMGYVAVIREWFMGATSNGIALIGVDAYLQRNGVDFPYNGPVGFLPGNDRKPCFMLVDEGQTVGARAPAGLVNAGAAGVNVYGTLIPKTGRAYPYEIANPIGVTRQATLAPESLYAPPPPPPPKEVVREVIREVVREAPPTQVQQPATPPPPPEAPPFEVKWIKQTQPREGSCAAGNGMYWTPTESIRGGRSTRNLTLEEVRRYATWLETHCPAPDNATRGRPANR